MPAKPQPNGINIDRGGPVDWIVDFKVVDDASGNPITSVASDDGGAIAQNADGIYQVSTPADTEAHSVLVQGYGILYESKVVTFTLAQAGTLQVVRLIKAPPPDPKQITPPSGLRLVSYENHQATFEWSNGLHYDKILFSWKFNGAPGDNQTTLDGSPTSHTFGPVLPDHDYIVALEGGIKTFIIGLGYAYSPNVSIEWHSPPGDWPVQDPGALVPGHRVNAVSRTPDNVDVFSVDSKGQVRTSLWHQGDTWTSFRGPTESLGGAFAAGAPLTALARTAEHLDLFATGPDGIVYTCYWAGGPDWTAWRPIGGYFPAGTPVAAVSRVPNQIDLFATAGNGQVYWQFGVEGSEWTGVSNDWTALGGPFEAGAPVAAVSRIPEHIDLFVVANDGAVHWSWWHLGSDWSGKNNPWLPLGGSFAPGTPITAISRTPTHVDLFATGTDGIVYTSYWQEGPPEAPSAPWTPWRRIGGYFPASAPVTAVSRVPNQIDLFITGNDGVVYWQFGVEGADWTGISNDWTPIGGVFPPGAPVAAVSRIPDHIDLFIAGKNGQAYWSWWQMGSDWSGKNNSWMPLMG
jgi:hypothetical protein